MSVGGSLCPLRAQGWGMCIFKRYICIIYTTNNLGIYINWMSTLLLDLYCQKVGIYVIWRVSVGLLGAWFGELLFSKIYIYIKHIRYI